MKKSADVREPSLYERYRQELIDAITVEVNRGQSVSWCSLILGKEAVFYKKLVDGHGFKLSTLMYAHSRIPLLTVAAHHNDQPEVLT